MWVKAARIRRGIWMPGGGILLMVLLAGGFMQLASAQPRTPQPARTTAVNPHAGWTDDQRHAAIATLQARTHAFYQQWLDDFVRRGRDPRILPRQPISGAYAPPLRDLSSAVAAADMIVVGTVQSARYVPGPGGYLTFTIERALKGSPGSEVMIYQAVGPAPTVEVIGMGGALMYAENVPILFPGDRAVLLLQRAGTEAPAGTHYVQSFTGGYVSRGGILTALPLNPFRSTVDGQSEQSFLTEVTRLVPR